jgi:hypothetical protein
MKDVPKDLNECVELLVAATDPLIIEELKGTDEDVMGRYHHSVGRNIRNNWGMWHSSPLSKYFFSIGIYHADDMSGIIFTSFHRHIAGRPLDVEGQVKYYDDFWIKSLGEAGYEEMKRDILHNYGIRQDG